jgi:hypothetical protein
MATPNYYDILGIPEFSEISQVKPAYRALAKQHHPDKNASENSANIMRQINEAYTVLGDEQQKHSYDVTLRFNKISGNMGTGADKREDYEGMMKASMDKKNQKKGQAYHRENDHGGDLILNVLKGFGGDILAIPLDVIVYGLASALIIVVSSAVMVCAFIPALCGSPDVFFDASIGLLVGVGVGMLAALTPIIDAYLIMTRLHGTYHDTHMQEDFEVPVEEKPAPQEDVTRNFRTQNQEQRPEDDEIPSNTPSPSI